jgi:hypothetical protein
MPAAVAVARQGIEDDRAAADDQPGGQQLGIDPGGVADHDDDPDDEGADAEQDHADYPADSPGH